MDSIETLIPDNEGNHLVVVLNFYEDSQKTATFQIPPEFTTLEIADISIEKLDAQNPLGVKAFFRMCHWLIEQFMQFPNAVFSFICSTDSLEFNSKEIAPELYRWHLFEALYNRYIDVIQSFDIESKEIVVGPEGYQTFARVFFRQKHAPVIHIVTDHITNKYSR